MGAWIETVVKKFDPNWIYVAPLVGAWIETDTMVNIFNHIMVAPLVGAWIETTLTLPSLTSLAGRSPCGSVD